MTADGPSHDTAFLRAPGGAVRLYVPGPLGPDAEIALEGGQAHYLLHVMRAKPGDGVLLFNGRDGEWRAHVTGTGRRAVTLRCEAMVRAQRPDPGLQLLFAPIKRDAIDSLVEKASELGVSALRPVITQRTIVTRVNLDRLRAHAVEAAEQAERLSVPQILDPLKLAAALDALAPACRLIFCDEAGAPPLRAALADAPPAPETALLIGPEGGFTPEERAMIRARPNALAVSLGPRIMRADTAALAALAAYQAIAGDWE